MTTGHRAYVAQRNVTFPELPGAQLPALACVLKVENTLVVWVLPHRGQGGCTTDCGCKVRRSNVVAHSAQAYSKIGILYSSSVLYAFQHIPVSVLLGKAHYQREFGVIDAAYSRSP